MIFGESAILDDGRLVTTPWDSTGVMIGNTFVPGPAMLMPDASIDDRGRIWIAASSHDNTRHVHVYANGKWLALPDGFGRRVILRLSPEGCRVAYTNTATTWICYWVDETGASHPIQSGTIPSGAGGDGMRDWGTDGRPRPMVPLDEVLHGHQVRGKVQTLGITLASSLDLPDQVVLTFDTATRLGTLQLGGADNSTLRISSNAKFWVGTKYVGRTNPHGPIPSVLPPLVTGPVYRPVPPVGRAAHVGFFNHHKPTTPLPGTCTIDVWDHGFIRVGKDIVGRFVAGDPGHEGDLANLNVNIHASRMAYPGLPVLAYWTRALWSGALPTGAQWLGVEAYQLATETDAALLAGIHTQALRMPSWYLGQCYTSNKLLTQELTHLPSVYSAALSRAPLVVGVIAFSGYNRPTGYTDHPEVHAPWIDLTHAVTGAPALPAWTPPVPPTPEPPVTRTIGMLTWIQKFITNENGGDAVGLVVANDRKDAEGHVLPQVVYAWQEMFLTFVRPGTVTIHGVSGRFWCAEHADTTTFMDPTAVVVCNRTAANDWELFDYIDNGDGTFSLKTQHGFYVCCEADGRIVANRTAIGEYEKFRAYTPGSGLPTPPAPGGPLPRIVASPNSPIFRTAAGAPWRLMGMSDFKGAEVYRRGDDVRPFANAYPGYNLHRVFAYTEGPNWTDTPWDSPTPQQCVDYVKTMNALGRYVWWVLLTSSNPARRGAALDQIAAFTAAGNLGLFLQGANEPERQHDGIKIETAFMHAALAASGYPWDNGYQDNTSLHAGTFADLHTKRDGEWPRRSHDAMDVYTPPSDAPAGTVPLKMPIVLGEPAKLEDVGGENAVDWKGYFGSGAFFGAGVVFHTMTGKASQLPTAAEQRMAAAALQAMQAFPADATLGAYSRIDGDGLRTYKKTKDGDYGGKDCMTRIRPAHPTAPEPGWTSLESDHVLYTR